MSENEAFIRCRGLTKSYQKGATTVTPLENLDLHVDEGSFLARLQINPSEFLRKQGALLPGMGFRTNLKVDEQTIIQRVLEPLSRLINAA